MICSICKKPCPTRWAVNGEPVYDAITTHVGVAMCYTTCIHCARDEVRQRIIQWTPDRATMVDL